MRPTFCATVEGLAGPAQEKRSIHRTRRAGCCATWCCAGLSLAPEGRFPLWTRFSSSSSRSLDHSAARGCWLRDAASRDLEIWLRNPRARVTGCEERWRDLERRDPREGRASSRRPSSPTPPRRARFDRDRRLHADGGGVSRSVLPRVAREQRRLLDRPWCVSNGGRSLRLTAAHARPIRDRAVGAVASLPSVSLVRAEGVTSPVPRIARPGGSRAAAVTSRSSMPCGSSVAWIAPPKGQPGRSGVARTEYLPFDRESAQPAAIAADNANPSAREALREAIQVVPGTRLRARR